MSRLRRRVLLGLAVGAALTVGALVVLVLGRERMVYPRLLARLERWAAARPELGLHVGALEDTSFSRWTAHDVEIRIGSPDDPRLMLRAERATLHAGPRQLAARRLDPTARLEVDGLEVWWMQDEGDTAAADAARAAPDLGPWLDLASWPGLELQEASFDAILADGSLVRLAAPHLALAPDRPDTGERTLSGVVRVAFGASARLREAEVALDGALRRARLEIDEVRLAQEPGPARIASGFVLALDPLARGDLVASAEVHPRPGVRVPVRFERRGGRLALEVEAHDLDLGSLSEVLAWTTPPIALPAPWGVDAELAGRLDADLGLRLAAPGSDRAAFVHLDARARGLRLGGEDVGALELRLHRAGGELWVQRARIDGPGPDVAIDALHLPGGAQDPWASLGAGAGRVRWVDDGWLARRLAAIGELSPWLDGVEGVDLDARLGRGRLDVERARVRSAAGRVEVSGAELWIEGATRASGRPEPGLLRGSGTGEVRLTDLSRLPIGLRDLLGGRPEGRLDAGVELSLEPGGRELGVHLDGTGVVLLDLPASDVRGALTWSEGVLSSRGLTVRNEHASASLSGAVTPLGPGPPDVTEIQLHDLLASVDLASDAAPTRWRSGSASLDLDGPLLAPRGRIDVDLEHSGGHRLVLRASDPRRIDAVDLAWRGCDDRAARVRLGLDGLDSWARGGELRLPISKVELTTDGRPALASFEPNELRWDAASGLDVSPFALDGPAGRVLVAARLAADGLALDAVGSDLDARTLLPLELPWPLVGRVDRLEASAAVNIERLSGTGRVELFAGDTVRLAGVGTQALGVELLLEGERLRIGRADLEIDGIGSADLSGSVAADLERRSARPDLALAVVIEPRSDVLAALGAGLPEPWRGELPSALAGGRAALEATLAETLRIDRLSLELPGANAHLELDGGLGRTVQDSAGLLTGELDWRDVPFTLRASGTVEDLARLAAVVPEVRTASGRADLEAFELTGPLAEPQGTGRLTITDGTLKLAAELPALDDVQLDLLLDGRRLVLASLEGRLASAPVRADGTCDLGPDPRFLVRVTGRDVLLARNADLRVRGDLDLRLRGPWSGLAIDGAIDLASSRFSKSYPLLSLGYESFGRSVPYQASARGFVPFSIRQPPFTNARFDVALTAKEPFRIDNNLAKGGLRPDLRLRGTGLVPELVGTVYLDETRVNLPATRLRLDSGTIRFEPDDPFVPDLELFGTTRMRGYDLRVSVSGDYDEPTVEVTSSPPLPPGDALVLLTTGQLPESAFTAQGTAQTARLLAVYLVQDLGASLFGGGEGESFADRFEFVRGEDITEDGSETVFGSYRVLRDVLFSGDQLRLTGEYDRFQEVNFGLRFLYRFE